MRPRFSLGSLFLLVTLCAVSLGWWLDHHRMDERYSEVKTQLDTYEFTHWEIIGHGLVRMSPKKAADYKKICDSCLIRDFPLGD